MLLISSNVMLQHMNGATANLCRCYILSAEDLADRGVCTLLSPPMRWDSVKTGEKPDVQSECFLENGNRSARGMNPGEGSDRDDETEHTRLSGEKLPEFDWTFRQDKMQLMGKREIERERERETHSLITLCFASSKGAFTGSKVHWDENVNPQN